MVLSATKVRVFPPPLGNARNYLFPIGDMVGPLLLGYGLFVLLSVLKAPLPNALFVARLVCA
jgi:hypothetical protein